jgi:hypothetical protein
MTWVSLFQYGTAIALGAAWLLLTVAAVRRIGRRGLWLLLTAPLFVAAWYVLEFGGLMVGCIRNSGAGC